MVHFVANFVEFESGPNPLQINGGVSDEADVALYDLVDVRRQVLKLKGRFNFYFLLLF